MARLGLLIASLFWALQSCGVVSYVVGPLNTYKTLKPRTSATQVQVDDSMIHFPSDEEPPKRRQRSVYDRIHFPDLYPQIALQDHHAGRLVRQEDPWARGPQNTGWRNPPSPWGNQGFNNNPRQPSRQWGNPGGTFNGPDDNDYEDTPFVFDRPSTNGNGGNPPRPGGGGGGNRPQPGGGGNRPQPGGGGARPQPGAGGGGNRPQPGGGGARPQPGAGGGGNRPQPGGGRPQPGGGGARPQPGAGGGGNRPQPGSAGARPQPGGGRPRPPNRPPPPTTPPPLPGVPMTTPVAGSTRPGCNCPSTPEFNPVCGEDKVTYSNPGKLRCSNFCGNVVRMVHYGSCITTTTPPPTN